MDSKYDYKLAFYYTKLWSMQYELQGNGKFKRNINRPDVKVTRL